MNIAEHFQALAWTETTVQVETKTDGTVTWPRWIGTSTDGKTAVELIGSPDNIRIVSLLGEMSTRDMSATARNGAYAAICLAIVAPTWKGRDQWLRARMQQLRATRTAQIIQNGWHIFLSFESSTSIFTFKATR